MPVFGGCPHQRANRTALGTRKPHHALEASIGVEQVICPMSLIADGNAPIPDREHLQDTPTELAWPVADAPELGHQLTSRINDDDAEPPGPTEIADEQIAFIIEANAGDVGEGLPSPGLATADAQHLFQGGGQGNVIRRQVDDALAINLPCPHQ